MMECVFSFMFQILAVKFCGVRTYPQSKRVGERGKIFARISQICGFL